MKNSRAISNRAIRTGGGWPGLQGICTARRAQPVEPGELYSRLIRENAPIFSKLK
jgi:hypothetical protein